MQPQTIVIDNFSANLTRITNGDLTSGYARYLTNHGTNPFYKPIALSFMENAVSIAGSVITDCIVAAKERVESGTLYVYAIGSTGRLYKIQVNNTGTQNPNYDTPVLLATISTNSPTFTKGGSMQFYSGYIFIGHDVGVTQINFDGTGETFVGSTGSWIQSVPRPSMLFAGNIYFGNGNNIAEITSGLIVTTYTKISPGFPVDYEVRDLDVTDDGVYLIITIVRTPLSSIFSSTPDTTSVGSIDSVSGYWNGADAGATSFLYHPNFNQSAYITYGSNEYLFGSDAISPALITPQQKLITLDSANSPMPNAMAPIGNLVAWMNSESNGTKLVAGLHIFGQFDQDMPTSHRRLLQIPSPITNADILKVPLFLPVSNFAYGGVQSGYSGNVIGSSKAYFSTIEYNGSAVSYNFYSLNLYPLNSSNSVAGVYETTQQLFGKKVVCKEVRIYLEPAAAGQSFQIDIIGIDGNVLTDAAGAKIFTVGTNLNSGDTIAWYNPAHIPSPAIGIRITNAGTVTPFIHKIELDIVPQGK